MDARAISNFILQILSNRMGLLPEMSGRRITTATGDKSPNIGLINQFPIFSIRLQRCCTSWLLKIYRNMIIGRPTMRRLNENIDGGKQTFSLGKDGEEVIMPLVIEYIREER